MLCQAGFVGPTERPRDTALRKLYEKTRMKEVYLEQLAAFADPGRDFRGWIPSIAYLALVPAETNFSDDTAEWAPARNPPPLAFDHAEILAKALDRVEGKLWWSNVAVGILPDAFSMAEARSVYEAVAETQYDPATFARDLQATGLVEPVGRRRAATRGRPALLYRFSSRDLRWGSGRRKRIKAQGA